VNDPTEAKQENSMHFFDTIHHFKEQRQNTIRGSMRRKLSDKNECVTQRMNWNPISSSDFLLPGKIGWYTN
jgi:hypothetical protein